MLSGPKRRADEKAEQEAHGLRLGDVIGFYAPRGRQAKRAGGEQRPFAHRLLLVKRVVGVWW